ncbi:hypothetical protein PS15m_010431 [Mucor circinelloides]
MSCSDLDILSLHEYFEEYEYDELEPADQKLTAFKFIRKRVSIEENQMASLLASSLSSQQVQYFVLKEEYLKYTTGWPGIVIECESLDILKLGLGALVVELKIAAERQIKSIKDWMQESHLVLLQQLHPSV